MTSEETVNHFEERRKRFRGGELGRAHGIRHILVCVDGSHQSGGPLAYALSLADTFDSAVTLTHVVEHHEERLGAPPTDAFGWEIARQEAQARLAQLEEEAALQSGRRINVRLEEGKPAERIVALSREIGVDLVALGASTHHDLPAWELGRTAQQVLADGSSSILIARGHSVSPIFAPPKRILVPLDGSLRTEGVLPIAERIARAHAAELVLIHVVSEPSQTSVLSAPEDLEMARTLATRMEAQAAQYLEGLRHQVGHDEAYVVTRVERQPDKRRFLVELSENEGVDLIVLSAHGRTCDVGKPFGSVTAHMLTHSKTALLILQDVPPSELRTHIESEERLAPPLRGAFPPQEDG